MKTQYYANKLLNDNRSSMFLALFNGNPLQGGIEIAQSSRTPLSLGAANDGYVANTAALSFTSAASNLQSKVANHWGVYDAATGGNLLYAFPISYDVLCEVGVAIPIGVGSLILKEA